MGLIISFFSSLTLALQKRFQSSSKDEILKRKFSPQSGITLYDTSLSPPCRRVRMVLIQKGMRWRNVSVDLISSEQNSIYYKKLCPNQKVPALTIKDIPCLEDCTFYESGVITEYLDDVIPGERLYPTDFHEKTQVLSWLDWELGLGDDFPSFAYQNLFGPFLRAGRSKKCYKMSTGSAKIMLMKIFAGNFKRPEEMIAHAENLYNNLFHLEQALEKKSYLVGKRITMADVAVYSRVVMYDWIGLHIYSKHFPNIRKWLDNMHDIEFVAASMPLGMQILIKFLPWVIPVIEFIGNWRSGWKFERFNGSKIIDRLIAEHRERNFPLEKPISDVSDDVVILFDYTLAAECWQIKILLEYKNLDFKTIPCDDLEIIGRPMGSEGIIRIQHGGKLITGIKAIMEYVDGISTNNGVLIPDDPTQKAECHCWQSWERSLHQVDMYPAYEKDLFPAYLHSRFQKDNLDDLLNLRSDINYQSRFISIISNFLAIVDPADSQWEVLVSNYGHFIVSEELKKKRKMDSQKALHERFVFLNIAFKNKRYILGEEMTLADILLFGRLLFMPYAGMKISVQKYPKISRWMGDMRKRSDIFTKISNELQSKLDKYMYADRTQSDPTEAIIREMLAKAQVEIETDDGIQITNFADICNEVEISVESSQIDD